jgi:hypothetical protein
MASGPGLSRSSTSYLDARRPSAFRCFVSAINSFIVATLSAAGTTATSGAALMRLIGAKLRVGMRRLR